MKKDISSAFEKVAVTSSSEDHCKTQTNIFSHFKSQILAAIHEIRKRKSSTDTDAIYEQITKSEASNADKDLIETIIAERANQKVIVNYKSSTVKQR